MHRRPRGKRIGLRHGGQITGRLQPLQSEPARLRNEFGVQIAMLPDDALTRMGEITAQILDVLRSEAAPEHQAIFDSYLEARMQIRAWRELTEIPFAQARKLPFDYPQPS